MLKCWPCSVLGAEAVGNEMEESIAHHRVICILLQNLGVSVTGEKDIRVPKPSFQVRLHEITPCISTSSSLWNSRYKLPRYMLSVCAQFTKFDCALRSASFFISFSNLCQDVALHHYAMQLKKVCMISEPLIMVQDSIYIVIRRARLTLWTQCVVSTLF